MKRIHAITFLIALALLAPPSFVRSQRLANDVRGAFDRGKPAPLHEETATIEARTLGNSVDVIQVGGKRGKAIKYVLKDGRTAENKSGLVVYKSNRRQVAATEPGTTEKDVSGSTATEPTTATSTSSAVSSQSRARRPVVIPLGNGGTMTIVGSNANTGGNDSGKTERHNK